MKIRKIHLWNVPPEEAILIQKRLLKEIRIEPLQKMPLLVASRE